MTGAISCGNVMACSGFIAGPWALSWDTSWPNTSGSFIRTEIIEAAGLTVTAAAHALRVSRPTLSSLLNGKADLSGDMALRIEKAFGVKMDTLMRMQSSYDIAQTRKRENLIRVPRISVLAATH
jgi:addiction module HigA family antidote